MHVNTLLLQEILAEPKWAEKLTDADRRALSAVLDSCESVRRVRAGYEQQARTQPAHSARPTHRSRRGGTGR